MTTTIEAWANSVFNSDYADPVSEFEERQMDFKEDVLVLVCALHRENYAAGVIAEVLQMTARKESLAYDKIKPEDYEQAKLVRKHFQNKILIRRLQNKVVTSFMQAVEELLESSTQIKAKQIAPLVKLPHFYEEDKQVEALIKEHKSCGDYYNLAEGVDLEYVETVERRTRANQEDVQFWRTPDDRLVQVALGLKDNGSNAWKFFAEQGKINVTAVDTPTRCLPGYDFRACTLELEYKINSIG